MIFLFDMVVTLEVEQMMALVEKKRLVSGPFSTELAVVDEVVTVENSAESEWSSSDQTTLLANDSLEHSKLLQNSPANFTIVCAETIEESPAWFRSC